MLAYSSCPLNFANIHYCAVFSRKIGMYLEAVAFC